MPYRKDRIKKIVGFSPTEWETVCRRSAEMGLRTRHLHSHDCSAGSCESFPFERAERRTPSLESDRRKS